MPDDDIIKFQLNNIYRSIDISRDSRMAVKKWASTVWLGVLVAMFSGKLPIDTRSLILILLLCIGVFWFYEGVIAVHTMIFERMARELEAMLLSAEQTAKHPKRLLLVTGLYSASFREKICSFLYACFAMETIVFFYLVLMLVGVFTIVLKSTT